MKDILYHQLLRITEERFRVHSVLLKHRMFYAILELLRAGLEGEYEMGDKLELSKQRQKSKETKEKIFRAAKEILRKKGYEELSIKNICEEAGVSNGSFYHHFKTKDDLLSYYIEDQPSINPDLLDVPVNLEEAKIAIIHVYLNYVEYCRELGVEFMSGYYDPKNQALNPSSRTERPYPIVTVQTYVEKAVAENIIQLNVDIEAFTTDIRMIVIGNVFEWCLSSGKADFEGNMRRSLGKYLNSTIFEGMRQEKANSQDGGKQR